MSERSVLKELVKYPRENVPVEELKKLMSWSIDAGRIKQGKENLPAREMADFFGRDRLFISPDFSLVSNMDSLVVNAAFLVFSSVRLRDDYYE